MTDKIAVERDFLEHTVVALEYAYSADDEMVMESIRFLRAALAQQAEPQEPVAWINTKVIYDHVADVITGYGEPELSFERLAYGYDYVNAVPLYRAAPQAQPASAQCSPTLTECPRCKNDIAKCDSGITQPAPAAVPLTDDKIDHTLWRP